MRNMYPITVLGFILLAAVTIAPVTYFAATPYVVPPEVLALETGQPGKLTTATRDQGYFGVMPPPTAETPAAEIRIAETQTVETQTSEPAVAEAVATPNHDP